jgi:hypothetical protein
MPVYAAANSGVLLETMRSKAGPKSRQQKAKTRNNRWNIKRYNELINDAGCFLKQRFL